MEAEEGQYSEGQVVQVEGYNVTFITNGVNVEYNGKTVADGETVVSTKAPMMSWAIRRKLLFPG